MADDKPQTLAAQGLVNRIARVLLRAPGISRIVGRRLLTLHVVGRRTGKRYAVPVAYTPHQGALLVGTPFGWARNLRTGHAVEVDYRGRRRTADVRVETEEAAVVAGYAIIARDNHSFGSFNKIGYDASGEPVPEDLHRAWRNGARVIRLTLRR